MLQDETLRRLQRRDWNEAHSAVKSQGLSQLTLAPYHWTVEEYCSELATRALRQSSNSLREQLAKKFDK